MPMVSIQRSRISMTIAFCALAALISLPPTGVSCMAGDEGVAGWRAFFPGGSSVSPLRGLGQGEEAYEVLGKDGTLRGWVFRTDRVDPEVKGLVSQLAVLVAVSRDRKILRVRLIGHGDAPGYVERLRDDFYGQFEGLSVDDEWETVDTVTGATFSSSAIARDVVLSCRRLLSVASPPR